MIGIAGPVQMQPIVDNAHCLPQEQVFLLREQIMSISGGTPLLQPLQP